jgi:hypothetical protein
MKNGLLSLVKKAVAPVALVAAMVVFSPVRVMAQNRGGHEGGRAFSGGHSYATPDRGNSANGRAFSERGNTQRGGDFNRGNSERRFDGGDRGEFRGDRDFHGDRDRGFYRPGFGFGVGVYPSYGYAAPVCNPSGFYDQWGNWHFYPGCAVPY